MIAGGQRRRRSAIVAGSSRSGRWTARRMSKVEAGPRAYSIRRDQIFNPGPRLRQEQARREQGPTGRPKIVAPGDCRRNLEGSTAAAGFAHAGRHRARRKRRERFLTERARIAPAFDSTRVAPLSISATTAGAPDPSSSGSWGRRALAAVEAHWRRARGPFRGNWSVICTVRRADMPTGEMA